MLSRFGVSTPNGLLGAGLLVHNPIRSRVSLDGRGRAMRQRTEAYVGA